MVKRVNVTIFKLSKTMFLSPSWPMFVLIRDLNLITPGRPGQSTRLLSMEG